MLFPSSRCQQDPAWAMPRARTSAAAISNTGSCRLLACSGGAQAMSLYRVWSSSPISEELLAPTPSDRELHLWKDCDMFGLTIWTSHRHLLKRGIDAIAQARLHASCLSHISDNASRQVNYAGFFNSNCQTRLYI